MLEHTAQAQYLVQAALAFETFGLTMVEALALGTPVIGLNTGTQTEFIQDGYNGFICAPEALKATLIKAKSYSAYHQLTQKAQASADLFQTERVLKQQIELYQQLC